MPELQPRIFANERPIYEKIVHGIQHHIRVFGRYSTQAQRAHARQVLDATYQDLPGLEYSDNELASEVPDPLQPDSPNMVPRFKFYVYYIGRKVIGALLVERYHQFQSRQLVERSRGPPLQGKRIIFDRLWVSPSHRRLGYASKMADNARVTFIPGFVCPKEAVAMPEQTSMGSGFARTYFK
jgi:ribosomal protein S18 acetylase RimI-like enzyme